MFSVHCNPTAGVCLPCLGSRFPTPWSWTSYNTHTLQLHFTLCLRGRSALEQCWWYWPFLVCELLQLIVLQFSSIQTHTPLAPLTSSLNYVMWPARVVLVVPENPAWWNEKCLRNEEHILQLFCFDMLQQCKNVTSKNWIIHHHTWIPILFIFDHVWNSLTR